MLGSCSNGEVLTYSEDQQSKRSLFEEQRAQSKDCGDTAATLAHVSWPVSLRLFCSCKAVLVRMFCVGPVPSFFISSQCPSRSLFRSFPLYAYQSQVYWIV